MQVENAVAFVSGANRGVGARFVTSLLERGARKVYAAARDTRMTVANDPRIVPVTLDITDPDQVEQAALLAPDVTLLINNAGINRLECVIRARDADAARDEMEVNYFGTLRMCRAFEPALVANGGAIVNMLSVLARITLPGMGSLCASKAASLRMTEGLRAEMAAHHVRVLAILPGAIDTDMSRDFPPPKLTVSEVVNAVFDALDGDTDEVYVGEMAIGVAAGLAVDRQALQMQFASYL
jgi:NAD(P)-dependent dehydrogenase (short-subunit alcohol dehydrogenase family)